MSPTDDLASDRLHSAAQKGDLEEVHRLVAAGEPVDRFDDLGATPLRSVAGSCTLETARLLIDSGADPTIPGWMGLTALDVSGERKREEGRRVHALLEQAAPRHEPSSNEVAVSG